MTLDHRDDPRVTRRSAVARVGVGAGLSLVTALMAGRGVSLAAAQEATPAVVGGGPAGYLVIRRYRLQPDASYDELVRRVERGFVPIIAAVPGFVEYLFVDPGNGEHVAVGVFTDQAGADRSTTDAGSWAEENVADLVELPAFEVIGGAVRLHAVVNGAGMMATPSS